jgi:hypothetical protein
LIWGPYETLKAGSYRFECLIEPLGEEARIKYDIAADMGRRKLCAGVLCLRRGQYPQFDLRIDDDIEHFELRLYGDPPFDGKPFRFLGLRFIRQGAFRAVHQSEAMALLAHLAALRVRHPFTTEVL